jgi:hypothetical protein
MYIFFPPLNQFRNLKEGLLQKHILNFLSQHSSATAYPQAQFFHPFTTSSPQLFQEMLLPRLHIRISLIGICSTVGNF